MTFIDYIQLFNDAVRYYNRHQFKKMASSTDICPLNTITDLQVPTWVNMYVIRTSLFLFKEMGGFSI